MLHRPAAILIAAALMLAAPAPMEAAPASAITYQADRTTLSIPLPATGVPSLQEVANPPRLLIDLPGTALQMGQDQEFAAGRVSRMTIAREGQHTRVTLYLRQPVRGQWALGFADGKLTVALPPLKGQPVATPKPSAKPTAKPTPKPTAKPTPRPTAKPTPKPTAKPQVKVTPKPTPKPPAATPRPVVRPSIQPTATPMPATPAPTAKPTPAPTTAPMATPPAATPTPTARPSAAPTATPTPGVKVTPAPTAKPTPAPTPKPTPKPPAATPRPQGTPGIAPVKPAQGDFARLAGISYDEDVRFLQISLSRKVTPRFALVGTRLIADLPGTVVGETQARSFPNALVQNVTAYQYTPTDTRVIVTFARAIGKNWGLKQSGGNIIMVFDHKPVNAPGVAEPPAATPKPAAATPKPQVKVTPKPMPKPTPRPTPKPTPKPTPHPTPKPTAKPQVKATPKPAATQPKGGHAFTGTVFHINTGEPVAGVHVNIAGHTATTDASGRFSVQGLPNGRLQVVVTANGFASQSFDILVPEDKSLSLNLVPALK